MSLNKAMLIGRLTRDPEMRYTPSGAPVTNFGMATNRYQTGPDGERKEFTDFHNIVAWNIGRRNLAEICAQFLRKGSQVYVEGRLSTRSWEGQDGQKRTRTEVVINDIEFLDSRGSAPSDESASGATDDFAATTPVGAAAPAAAAPAVPAAEAEDINPDDIPF